MIRKIIFSLLLLLAVSCTKNEIKNTTQKVLEIPKTKTSEPVKTETLKEKNNDIVLYFKEKNYKKIVDFIHPKKGISFSMYLTVHPETDQHFTKEEFLQNLHTNKIFNWGKRDGSGKILELNLRDYLNLWVFNKDFSAATYSQNNFEIEGNSLNNIKKTYPNADFTVNYLKGTSENSKMDWQNLIFVYERHLGKNYLIAVINDKWTI